jgi:hypothetical protein
MEKRIKRKISVLVIFGIFMAIALSTSVIAVEDHNDDLDMDDNQWIGLSATEGRIVFDDQATDEIEILDANVGIATSSPIATLDVDGGFAVNIRVAAGTDSATSVDHTILVDTSGGVATISLPQASTVQGLIIVIKNIDTSDVTIDEYF